MRKLRAGLGCLAVLTMIGLIISGLWVIFSNRCFFHQFTPPDCTGAQESASPLGVRLLLLGVLTLSVGGVVAIAAARASRGRSHGDADRGL
jgi:hypothetical protein